MNCDFLYQGIAKLPFFTKINSKHVVFIATAHAQLIILAGWAYNRARTSKQKRGWAFIPRWAYFREGTV